MWVRRGVTVWRAPPASSLPRPQRPIPGRWLVPEPPPGRDRPICVPALRGGQLRAPSPPAVAPQAGRGFKTSFQKRVSGRALRPPPAPSPARFRRARRGVQFKRPTCPRTPSFARRWSVRVPDRITPSPQCSSPAFLKNEWDPPSAPAPPPVTASRAAARRPPTHHATRTARVRVLAVPVGRCWLFQDFSLRRLLPGAARSDVLLILLLRSY